MPRLLLSFITRPHLHPTELERSLGEELALQWNVVKKGHGHGQPQVTARFCCITLHAFVGSLDLCWSCTFRLSCHTSPWIWWKFPIQALLRVLNTLFFMDHDDDEINLNLSYYIQNDNTLLLLLLLLLLFCLPLLYTL